jgi:hypothetical protein
MHNTECIGGLSKDSLGYDWHELQVHRNLETGILGYGESSGCSCDSWDSDFWLFNQLIVIDNTTWNEFQKDVDEFPCSAADKTELLSLVAKELKKNG